MMFRQSSRTHFYLENRANRYSFSNYKRFVHRSTLPCRLLSQQSNVIVRSSRRTMDSKKVIGIDSKENIKPQIFMQCGEYQINRLSTYFSPQRPLMNSKSRSKTKQITNRILQFSKPKYNDEESSNYQTRFKSSKLIYLTPNLKLGIKETSLNKNSRDCRIKKGISLFKNNPYDDTSNKVEHKNIKQYKVGKGNMISPIKKRKKLKEHEFYFCKTDQGKKNKNKKQNEKNKNLGFPVPSNQNIRSRGGILTANYTQIKSPSTSVMKYWHQPKNNQLQSTQTEIILEKQYSICEDSKRNISKINMEQVQSILNQGSGLCLEPVQFILQESIIIRGIHQNQLDLKD